MMRQKIAFIKCGSFSNTNSSVLSQLEKNYSDYEIDVIDVNHLLLSHYQVLLINFFVAFKEYGFKKLFSSKKNFLWYYFTTCYLFRATKKILSKHLSKSSYIFTLQTQAFVDASQPGIPHFVYTDDTMRAKLYYPNSHEFEPWPQSKFEQEKSVLHHAVVNFTMSNNVKKSMIEQYDCDPEKVVCIYAGSNVKLSQNYNGARDYHQKNILFVGIDWERKGGAALVEAFKLVLETHPDARLTIVGCSPKLDVPNCHVVGRVPLEEVRKFYEEASIFCLPTTLEPFGIVFIEALMYKLPVIATDIAAIPDFVTNGENGYLVQPNNVEQIAKALIELLSDPNKCQAFGEKGYDLVIKRYSWDNVGRRMKEVIETVINKTPKDNNQYLIASRENY